MVFTKRRGPKRLQVQERIGIRNSKPLQKSNFAKTDQIHHTYIFRTDHDIPSDISSTFSNFGNFAFRYAFLFNYFQELRLN